MSRLQISLLGPFRVILDGQPVVGFRSDKVRALLAYLAVEAAREHSRDVAAGLLWPEWTEREALANLRYSLSNLRQVIGDRVATPPFLLISRDTLQFNLASDHALDVRTFEEQITLAQPDALTSAISLYRGPFLEGFSLADAAAFEDWALLKREELARQLWLGLGRLADHHQSQGEHRAAEGYARRRVELEPWEEEGQRQLMRALTLGGQRSAALQQYHTCVRVLKEELGAEPQAETTALYRQIQAGELESRSLEVTARGPREQGVAVPGRQAGTPLPADNSSAATAAQRRLVTSMCCQIRARIAEGPLDPEDAAGIMAAARELVAGAVQHHQGTLMASTSSEVLALFGAVAAHEDDPERAVRAALEVTAAAEPRNDFSVQVGISTGLLLVERSGADLANGASLYRATGEAVTLAVRLSGHAPESGILIGHDTYRHIGGVFDIKAQAQLPVEGRAASAQCYQVLRAKPRSFRWGTRGTEGVETRMVGRELELQGLQRAYQDVLSGAETRFVTTVGEAGVGKSRLLYEFEDWLNLQPGQLIFFKGRAPAATQAVPFSLVRDLFAHHFEILESDPAAQALAKFRRGMTGVLSPEQSDLVGQLAGFDFGAAGSGAVQGFLGSEGFGHVAGHYFVEYFRGLLLQQPVVMLLEDLHWADDSSLDLLAELTGRIPAGRFLILGTARPEFYERRPNWGEGQPAYSRLDVRPLSRLASGELVDEILQKAPRVPNELRDMLVVEAEGNPFYLEELVKMLIEDGAIVVREEKWEVLSERLARLRPPSTLAGVLQARLDALSVDERAVLQRAAVVGRVFWDTIVAELAADVVIAGQLEGVLERLRQRELIFRREKSRLAGTREYIFKHALLRDVTYETVLLQERRQWHGRVAAWLEGEAGQRLAEHLTLVAGHYQQAGQAAKAVTYLQWAGDEAYKVGALRDARTAFERGLALLGDTKSVGLRDGARLLVGLGRVCRQLGDLQEASERLEAGRALAREVGDSQTEACALVTLGEAATYMGQYERAYQLLEEGLALARTCADQSAEGDAMFWLSYLYYHQNKYEQAIHWGEASLALCRTRGDRWGAARSLNGLMVAVALRPANYERARSLGLESLALSRELGDLRGMSAVQCDLGGVAYLEGRYGEARDFIRQGRLLAEQIGARTVVIMGRMVEALLDVDDGRASAAWAQLRAGLREAWELHAVSYCLVGVSVAARLYARNQLLTQAAELAGLSLQVRAVWWAKDWAAFSAALRQALSSDELEAALARGKELDLEQTVEEILAAADAQVAPVA